MPLNPSNSRFILLLVLIGALTALTGCRDQTIRAEEGLVPGVMKVTRVVGNATILPILDESAKPIQPAQPEPKPEIDPFAHPTFKSFYDEMFFDELDMQFDSEAPTPVAQKPRKLPNEIVNSLGMRFRLIEPGSFIMGSPEDEAGSKLQEETQFGFSESPQLSSLNLNRDQEERQHRVTISKPYYLAVCEVTVRDYAAVMTNFNDSGELDLPIRSVSWFEANDFCQRLSSSGPEYSAAREYRLPTEAEWEYACRAGTTSAFSVPQPSLLGTFAWFKSNSSSVRHPVGSKIPNPWGLHDMHGNVGEWCSDWFGNYPSTSVTDPTGQSTGTERVVRGGTCNTPQAFCRSANRFRLAPDQKYDYIGFRIVLEATASKHVAETLSP